MALGRQGSSQDHEVDGEVAGQGTQGFGEAPVKNTVVKLEGRPCLSPADWLDRAIEPPDRLLGDLFSTTARILFAADTGIGKTMLAMGWAFAMALGKDFLHWKGRRN